MSTKESPQLAHLASGGANTMFIEVERVDRLHAQIESRIHIVMPLVTQWYGMREFAVEDPEGFVITFAERVQK